MLSLGITESFAYMEWYYKFANCCIRCLSYGSNHLNHSKCQRIVCHLFKVCISLDFIKLSFLGLLCSWFALQIILLVHGFVGLGAVGFCLFFPKWMVTLQLAWQQKAPPNQTQMKQQHVGHKTKTHTAQWLRGGMLVCFFIFKLTTNRMQIALLSKLLLFWEKEK